MRLKSRLGLQRVWPLLFSFVALAWLSYLVPNFWEDYRFVRDGVEASGWYTDLDEQNDRLHYAYRVADAIYGGDQSWNDVDSDIYAYHNGHELSVTFLRHTPWVSRRALDNARELRESEQRLLFHVAVFLAGIGLSKLRLGRKQSAVAST